MSQGMHSHHRNENTKNPIRAFNTTLTRGGARDHLYPKASNWEGIEAAKARENIDPTEVILTSLASLRERFYATLDKNITVDPRKTKAKIAKVRSLIAKFSGNKERFLQELAQVEVSFNSQK